jgi:hypothetical protein
MPTDPWRDGDRIAVPYGGGYSDRVPDADIRSHLEDGIRDGDVRVAVNAAATLALREHERRVVLGLRRAALHPTEGAADA